MLKLSPEEQHELNLSRTRAVNQAKREEAALIRKGLGTRDWTPVQQREWLQTGRCADIKGHHMKDVTTHPEFAGDKNNIQMLTHKEHYDAHGGNYQNSTNGYYNPATGRTRDFGDNPPTKPPVQKLSNPLSERAVKYNTTLHRNAEAQKAEARKLKSEGLVDARGKAHSPEKHTMLEKTDSKTLERDRSGALTSEKHSSQSKTLTNDRSRSASTAKGRVSENHSHHIRHNH